MMLFMQKGQGCGMGGQKSCKGSREVMSLSWTFLVIGAVEHSGAVTHQALLIMASVPGGKAGWRI